MKENKKLNKVLTIIILVCLLGAFIISVAARMYDNVIGHYKHMTTSTRPNPY
ncbi:MAG: hypothetical protein MJ200_03405 [Mycoplasmoidaceae bacterium]|nr:hypothetical protein [Mycoplasmoidaceae bacterium]